MEHTNGNASPVTGLELLWRARAAKPAVRYAMHRDGKRIGGWNSVIGRFQVVAFEDPATPGIWQPLAGERLIDGKPDHQPEDWIE